MTTDNAPPQKVPYLTTRLKAWLLDHPGSHKPVAIAKDMGLPTHTVAARLIYLSDHGEILRRRVSRSSSTYSAPRG